MKTQQKTGVLPPFSGTDGVYKQFVETSADFIFMIDADMTVVFVNAAGARSLGKKKEHIIGKTISAVFPKNAAAGYAKSLKSVFATGDPLVKESPMPAGEKTFFISTTLSPVKDALGKTVAVMGASRDITDRKDRETALAESEAQYRGLFENMVNGFAYCRMIYDKKKKPVDFTYLEINNAFERLTGLSRADVINKKITDAIPAIRKDNPELFEIYGRVAATGRPEHFETYVVGLKIWFHVSAYRLKPGHFVAVFETITERKHAEQKLKEKMEELEKMNAIMVGRELKMIELKERLKKSKK